MRSAASPGEDVIQSTETTESTQPAAIAQPEAGAQPEAVTQPEAGAQPGAVEPETVEPPAAAAEIGAAAAEPAAAQPARPKPAKRKSGGSRSTRRAPADGDAPPPSGSANGANGTAAGASAPATAKADQAPKAATTTTAARSSRRRTTRPRTRYAVGQQIVYPLQGVGLVERLEERDFQGKPTLYYVVYLEVSDMTIMIPVDKADHLGIRAIVSKRKAERALRLIAEDFDPIPTDWKLRYQMNLDLLKRGAVNDIASVVRSLSYRSRIKELPILERKLFDSALRLMVDEVSYSLGKDKSDIEQLIEERLANVKQKGDEEVKPKTA